MVAPGVLQRSGSRDSVFQSVMYVLLVGVLLDHCWLAISGAVLEFAGMDLPNFDTRGAIC